MNRIHIPNAYTLVFLTAGICFMVMLAMDISGILRTGYKAVPVSTLAVLVFLRTRGVARFGLVGALTGSVLGDIFLDQPQEGFFVFGLIAFLIAHLLYTALFFRFARRPDTIEKAIIGGLLVFALAMMWLFRGIDPELYPAVVLYIAVIVVMSIGALLVPSADRQLFWGAVLFIASDVVLAVNKFLIFIPHGRLINISLYFIAQYVIIRSALGIWGERHGGIN